MYQVFSVSSRILTSLPFGGVMPRSANTLAGSFKSLCLSSGSAQTSATRSSHLISQSCDGSAITLTPKYGIISTWSRSTRDPMTRPEETSISRTASPTGTARLEENGDFPGDNRRKPPPRAADERRPHSSFPLVDQNQRSTTAFRRKPWQITRQKITEEIVNTRRMFARPHERRKIQKR